MVEERRRISLFPYAGGKFRLIPDIREYFKASKCTVAVDVFGGSGKVLLNIGKANKYIYNDLNSRLFNVYKQLRDNPTELKRLFEASPYSRELWLEVQQPSPIPVIDAYRFIAHQYMAFGGKTKTDAFGYTKKGQREEKTFRGIPDVIAEAMIRMREWLLEHLDFEELVEKYDTPHTFFYFDPPYWELNFYEHNFVIRDFTRLAKVMKNIKGSYLMNINADPNVIKVFGNPQEVKKFVNTTTKVDASLGEERSSRKEFFYTNVDLEKEESLGMSLMDFAEE